MDNFEWTNSLTFRAFGVVLEIRTDEPKLMPLLLKYLPPGWTPSRARADAVFSIGTRTKARGRYSLFLNGQAHLESARLSLVLDTLEAGIRQYVAEMSPLRVFVHAGVVALNGKAIVIPGRSLSGKTTFVRELVRAGAVYYSDEYAVLDVHGRVHPYASPLAVRRKGSMRQARVSAESLGAQVGKTPLPVSLIVVSRYREGARWLPKQLTAGTGALELLNNTVPARRYPERVMPVLGRAVSEAVILKSARGEARDAARALLECFS